MNQIKICMMVDDDADDQELFELALRDYTEDTELVKAHSAIDALSYLQENLHKIPDVIFLDLNMPKMNGKECLQELRAHPVLKDIPVVVFSTSSDERDKSEVMQLGALSFISKPPRTSELTKIITKIFSALQQVKS